MALYSRKHLPLPVIQGAYTYQLSQTAFLAAMTDLEVAKVAAQEAGGVNRDSLFLAYKDAIATRYGLDRYALDQRHRSGRRHL